MRFSPFILIFLLISCDERSRPVVKTMHDTVATEKMNTVEVAASVKTDSLLSDRFPVWFVDAEKMEKRRNPAFREEYLQADSVIAGLNRRYPKVQLKKVSLRNDTLHAGIPDSRYLTQQMGSAGSAALLADAVINLTAVPGIRAIKLDFEEGDHAAPGVYSAANYKSIKELK